MFKIFAAELRLSLDVISWQERKQIKNYGVSVAVRYGATCLLSDAGCRLAVCECVFEVSLFIIHTQPQRHNV